MFIHRLTRRVLAACVAVPLSSLAGCSGAGEPPPPARPATAAAPACSRQIAAPLEPYQMGPGARGRVVLGGTSIDGWILLDTAATETRVRTAVRGDVERSGISARLLLGDAFAVDVPVTTSNALWAFDAPDGKGSQIATLETDVFIRWAVRIDTGDRRVYFSDDGTACPADALRRAGFHRMDTTGYYQRGGPFAPVGRWAAPLVPTVEIEVLGTRVRAQIDTGYEGPDLEVQINQKLLQALASRLGKAVGKASVDGVTLDTYAPDDGRVDFIDSDSNQGFARVDHPKFLVKPGDAAIAGWDVPAALLSAAVFFRAFDVVELRADQKAVWGSPRIIDKPRAPAGREGCTEGDSRPPCGGP